MAETTLRVLSRDYMGPLQPGDIYWQEHLKTYYICLPLPEVNYTGLNYTELALKDLLDHRWEVSGHEALDHGDASKLTIRPSIQTWYATGKSIHGYITAGKWVDC